VRPCIQTPVPPKEKRKERGEVYFGSLFERLYHQLTLWFGAYGKVTHLGRECVAEQPAHLMVDRKQNRERKRKGQVPISPSRTSPQVTGRLPTRPYLMKVPLPPSCHGLGTKSLTHGPWGNIEDLNHSRYKYRTR
jgi:hypothetical protein